MKRTIKRVLSCVFATALCLSLTATAFASTGNKSAGNYGKLYGSVSISGLSFSTNTTINSNPDNAYLGITLDAQDKNGNSLLETEPNYSSRGVTSFPMSGYITSDTYKLFSTHSVQGGTTNPAYAVYLVTSA